MRHISLNTAHAALLALGTLTSGPAAVQAAESQNLSQSSP